MSGIVGIVHRDGAPVDRGLLQHMTDFLAFRGPDAQGIWVDGSVGFGHALLRTTFEQARETQPYSLDGQVWITADARIDGQADLRLKLESRGRSDLKDTTDAALILHAYAQWGESCVEHLLGDFAFAVWDGRERKLFCARDHFGVKPFYYAQTQRALVFSNTLDCLRQSPAVSDQLDDLAIADFLLFGYYQEVCATAFADIRRLPAAHTLTMTNGTVRVTRYWTLPIEETVRYRRDQDYVDRFNELFGAAVGDRLRTDRVSVFMSGGLDSTSVAAVARRLFKGQGKPFDLRAYTVTYEHLRPDRERPYACAVAEHLDMPIQFLLGDHYTRYERWHTGEFVMPEPLDEPMWAVWYDLCREAATHGRVVLSGDGGDPVFYPSQSYLWRLAKQAHWWQVARDVSSYSWKHGRLPPLYIGTRVRRWLGRIPASAAFPEWLNPVFARRWGLQERWTTHGPDPLGPHPVRAEACGFLAAPLWPYQFEIADSGGTHLPLEVRLPFFDVRLVAFVLSVPPTPWCVHKELLRTAMNSALPPAVLRRPKTPLGGDDANVGVDAGMRIWLNRTIQLAELAEYVVPAQYAEIKRKLLTGAGGSRIPTSPIGLEHWMEVAWHAPDRPSISGNPSPTDDPLNLGQRRLVSDNRRNLLCSRQIRSLPNFKPNRIRPRN